MPEAFTQEEELNLRDLYLILRRYRRSLVITPIVFGLGAFLVSTFLVSPKFEASGTIQIGQVNKVPLELAVNLEARMHDESFAPGVVDAHQAVFMNGSDDTAVLLAERVKLKHALVVKQLKGTELVGFSLTSKHPEQVLAKATAVVDSVQAAHTALYQTGVESIKRQLVITDTQISSLKSDMDSLIGNHAKAQGLNAYNAVLDALVVQDRSNQMRVLINHRFELETSLNPAMTFNTKLLGKVFVSDKPVSPNVPLITLIALLLGLFLAVVMAFVRNALGNPPLQA